MKKLIAMFMVTLCVATVVMAGAQSKSAASTSAAHAITFSANKGKSTVSALYAKSGTATANIEIYDRTGDSENLTAVATNGATVLSIDNSGSNFASNDTVVVNYSNGNTPTFATLTGADATTVTLDTGVSQACTVKDKVYEVDAHTIFIGDAAFNPVGDKAFISKTDSPLHIKNTGVTNGTVLATVEW